jgi:hypothetical protein
MANQTRGIWILLGNSPHFVHAILRGDPEKGGWLVFRASAGRIGKICPSDAWLQRQNDLDPEIERKRFTAERIALKSLRDSGIVPVMRDDLETCRWNPSDPGCPERSAIVMEDVGNHDLRLYVKQLRQEHEDDAQFAKVLEGLVVDLYQAMRVFHGKGIFHRDLKPEHFRFTEDPDGPAKNRLRIIDWANAHTEYPTTPERDYPSLHGTKGFMSPQAQIGVPANFKAADDVFALAATIYHCVVGDVIPWESWESYTASYGSDIRCDEDQALKFREHVKQALISHGLRSESRLVGILVKALELNQDKRYRSADEVLNGLLLAPGLRQPKWIWTPLNIISEVVSNQRGLMEGLPAALAVLAAWLAFASQPVLAVWGLVFATLTLAAFFTWGNDLNRWIPRGLTFGLLLLILILHVCSKAPCSATPLGISCIIAGVACVASDHRQYRLLMAVALAPVLASLGYLAPLALATPLIVILSAGSWLSAGTGVACAFILTAWARSLPLNALWSRANTLLPVAELWGRTENPICDLRVAFAFIGSTVAVSHLLIWVVASLVVFFGIRTGGAIKLRRWGIASLILLSLSLLLTGRSFPLILYASMLIAPFLAWILVAEPAK